MKAASVRIFGQRYALPDGVVGLAWMGSDGSRRTWGFRLATGATLEVATPADREADPAVAIDALAKRLRTG